MADFISIYSISIYSIRGHDQSNIKPPFPSLIGKIMLFAQSSEIVQVIQVKWIDFSSPTKR